MKYLNTDKQTMRDLSIQNMMHGERLISSLYLKTQTKKGKYLMQYWIENPLSDIEQIRKRQRAIEWNNLPELPLDEEELDFLEYYLDYREQLSCKGAFISSINKINRLVISDPSRYVIERGVSLVVKMLVKINDLQKNPPESPPTLIKEFVDLIRESFDFPELKNILEQYAESKVISAYAVDCYDYWFRQERLGVIKKILDVIYQLDVLRTAHAIAVKRAYCCCPVMTKTMDLSVSDFWHPFLQDEQKNDWTMLTGNISMFTGSNMAGKSTTLKALTTIIWLAHCGLPIPVKSMVCPVYEGIYTSINLPDSLRDGRSHFMAEVLRIKEVLQQAQLKKRCLVVLDEMFRGTNAQDAFEASVAVNKLLKEYTSCHFLISTHIIEYAKYFESDLSCCFYYMESEISNNRFSCSHRLKIGISESRVGYWLVQKELHKDLFTDIK